MSKNLFTLKRLFTGEETDYPEYTRKWLAVVGPAQLPEEAEVDSLRHALPRDASEQDFQSLGHPWKEIW